MNHSNCPNCRKWIVLFFAACAVVFIQAIVLTVLISRRGSDANTAIPIANQSASISPMQLTSPGELLLKYAEQGETANVESVLKQNPTLDVNRSRAEGNKTALYLACEKGYLDIVKLLLKQKADASVCDTTMRMGFAPFTIAARNGHLDVIKELLSSGIGIESRDDRNRTALYTAVANNRLDIVRFLCNANAEVNNDCGPMSWTPLRMAISINNIEAIKILLKHGKGIDLEKRDTMNNTILLNAVQNNNPELVRLLCEAGAKVNVYSNNSTPLTRAATKGFVEVIRVLLKYGKDIDVEMRERGGWKATPLFYAAWEGCTEAVEVLCKAGADLNASCKCGITMETPISIASERGHEDVVKVLKKYEKERHDEKESQESSRKKLEKLLK